MAAPQQTLSCKDVNAGPDHGYYMTVSRQSGAANVSSMTIAGLQTLTVLTCSFSNQQPSYPDQMLVIASCSEPQLVDAGYSVVIQHGGIAGVTMATLSQVSIAGAVTVARLMCQ